MSKTTIEESIELLEKTGSEEWNDALGKRLEPIASFLGHDEWKKGIVPYLKSVQGHAVLKMINESCSQEGISYLRGFIAGLRLVLCLEKSVDAQIAQVQSKEHKGVPTGTAGY